MSTATASPPPPPPPPPESKPPATKSEKKNRRYKKLLEGSGKQEYYSAKVSSTPDTSGGRSLIRSWLEGKLGDHHHHPTAEEGEGESLISPTAPAVSPTPISSAAPILMPQLDDGSMPSNFNRMEIVADATKNGITAVYDPFIDVWYLLTMDVYHIVFGTDIDRQPPPPPPPPPPVDENDDKNKVQTSAIKPKTILIGEIEVPVILAPTTTTTAEGYDDEQENNANEAAKDEAGKRNKKKNKNKKKKNKGKKK